MFNCVTGIFEVASIFGQRNFFRYPKETTCGSFKVGNLIRNGNDLSGLRLTLDEPKDLILIRKVFEALYKKKRYFILDDILNFFKQKSEHFLSHFKIRNNSVNQRPDDCNVQRRPAYHFFGFFADGYNLAGLIIDGGD